MIQNDPIVPPNLRASMQQLASNPAMLDQLSTMMRDPAMRSRMQNMMANGPGLSNPFAAPAPTTSVSTQQATGASGNNNSDGNDQDQTEEDMIAEAIRRSLEEN